MTELLSNTGHVLTVEDFDSITALDRAAEGEVRDANLRDHLVGERRRARLHAGAGRRGAEASLGRRRGPAQSHG